MDRLYDLAKVIRSKNSGPFEITLDVLFDREDTYRRVLDSGLICRKTIARLYGIPEESVRVVERFDAALGIKATFLRPVSSGTAGDRDVYGAQQHAPLADLMIP